MLADHNVYVISSVKHALDIDSIYMEYLVLMWVPPLLLPDVLIRRASSQMWYCS